VPVTQLIVAMAIAAIIYFAAGQAFAGSTDVGASSNSSPPPACCCSR
jgi:hypothetical protein